LQVVEGPLGRALRRCLAGRSEFCAVQPRRGIAPVRIGRDEPEFVTMQLDRRIDLGIIAAERSNAAIELFFRNIEGDGAHVGRAPAGAFWSAPGYSEIC